ncbi:MAG: methionyl-tRNA formyltransferase [Elusimicrobiales bacterium]|nr:methionyl-tRNA formyltransferase [Elusimicrobiales bacterium]MCK5106519.1 methionyl-tRNA formyltransferase [Elusimicrobiales bacterium]
MKIVFLGTPQIACGFLTELHSGGHEIVGVISQPDKTQGRGLCLQCPPVKTQALELNIPVFQPDTDEGIRELITSLKPDLCIAIAYGRFLKKDVLEMPKFGFLNIHFSLLPKYRGAAPVQRALINGEEKTGITCFWIEEKMDSGPIFKTFEVPILPQDDAFSLFEKLSQAGTKLLAECLIEIKKGNIIKLPQIGAPTFAPKIEKKDSWLDFNSEAASVYNKIRALVCGSKARFYSLVGGKKICVQIIKAALKDIPSPKKTNVRAGSIASIERGKGFYIQCTDSVVFIEQVQPEGKKPMNAADFINGARFKVGDKIAI